MTLVNSGSSSSSISRAPRPSSLADVLDLILDKGLVIDAYVRVSVAGIELLTIDARIVVASVDTYLRFAEAVGRLDLEGGKSGLKEVLGSGGDDDAEDDESGDGGREATSSQNGSSPRSEARSSEKDGKEQASSSEEHELGSSSNAGTTTEPRQTEREPSRAEPRRAEAEESEQGGASEGGGLIGRLADRAKFDR